MSDDLKKRLIDWEMWDEGDINDTREEAADRIEELEAKLAKTTKLLEQIERRLSKISGFFFDTFPRKEIRSLLEELKVQDDQ
jgi:uncharacterized alpha-E superfamily protein